MLRFLPFILRNVLRHRVRSGLTVAGIAMAMFLFGAIQALQRGVRDATERTAGDTTLVVYRQNRFCPATSRIPQRYLERIAALPGVASVVPMKIVVNNCRAALDVVTFRGVPPEDLGTLSEGWTIDSGSLDDWHRRSDAAIVGERLASRRRLQVGDSFDAAGVTVTVAAILRSEEPQEQSVAYVQLDFLQRAARGAGPGVVTQFNVRVQDPASLDRVAAEVDELFRHDAEPTTTRPEKSFVAQAGADIVEIVAFTRWLGWGCLAVVLGLVANAMVLGVQDRVRDHAVLLALGFRGGRVALLVLLEGALLGALGGLLGSVAAALVIHWGRFSLSTEGLSVHASTGWQVLASGMAMAVAVGALAGLVPAWRAGRREIASAFRAA